MRLTHAAILISIALIASGCGSAQNLWSNLENKAVISNSKQMRLLRAEMAMMLLSYVASDTSKDASADKTAVVVAMNQTALAIDCVRAAPDLAAKWKADYAGCGGSDELLFHTKMVSVDRALLSLARASLPTTNVASLLSALPTASAEPLSLIGPVLEAAKDAVAISLYAVAAKRDYEDIVFAAYCGTPPADHPIGCPDRAKAIAALRDNPSLGGSLPVAPPIFVMARQLTDRNCKALLATSKSANGVTVTCLTAP